MTKRKRSAKTPPFEPAKPGRPTDYNPDIATAICNRLAEGESLRSICTSEVMPAKATVFNWLRLHPEFLDHYARAREDQQESLADEGLDEARGVKSKEDAARANVFCGHVQWMAERLAPKKFGRKQEHHVTGDLTKLSEAELLEKAKVLMDQLKNGATGDE